MIEKAKSGKKQRKYGRNAKWCQRYKLEGKREKNKVVKISKHLKRFPADTMSARALDALKQRL